MLLRKLITRTNPNHRLFLRQSSQKYFKVTNKEEIHRGFVYKTGLNILDKPFEYGGSCVPGGLYFTTLEEIPEFYSYGCNLREITLPTDDPDFEMMPDENKFRANQIILGEKHSLLDIKTYQKFNLDPSQNYEFIKKMCTGHNLEVLKIIASGKGNTEILDHIISNFILDASTKDNIDELNWWKDSGLELKYSKNAIHYASANGNFDVLNWWKDSGLELKYSENAIHYASKNGRIDVLNWWKDSGLELKYSKNAMDYASRDGHIDILKWWKDSGLELEYSEEAMDYASTDGHIDILNWWKDSGLELKYSKRVMDFASKYGHIDILNWW